ncbi:hypothetical protein Acj133p072 [Acinetobacter phage 133]|uniref:Uncharacterized protein n=1 Tax=Acinetobacter phage 133 TaxID=2919552 RepID=Q6J2N2_9CAUD|nr:hypothetical protein Acj133p072 [Acinetobacter phage 133]AAT38501.1 hypothetical protein Acj133p072 [Acinetobacter phage 133]
MDQYNVADLPITKWQPDKTYKRGQLVLYNGKRLKCVSTGDPQRFELYEKPKPIIVPPEIDGPPIVVYDYDNEETLPARAVTEGVRFSWLQFFGPFIGLMIGLFLGHKFMV